MSARDDYPLGRIDVGSLGFHYTVEPGVWHNLCDELDSLRPRVLTAEADADSLAMELARWGWGDMHYGDQRQEGSVVAASQRTAALLVVAPIWRGGRRTAALLPRHHRHPMMSGIQIVGGDAPPSTSPPASIAAEGSGEDAPSAAHAVGEEQGLTSSCAGDDPPTVTTSPTNPDDPLVAASLRLERETGYDSIPTIAGHYTRYDDDGELLPTLECVMPGCSFRRKDAEEMWVHVHFTGHGKWFGFTIDELRADLTLEATP